MLFERFSQRRSKRSDSLKSSLLVAAAGGAVGVGTLALLAKPVRRARIRDRITSDVGGVLDLTRKARRDARNRAVGARHEAAAWMHRRRDERPINEDKLLARVRSTLGRYTTHPHAVDAKVSDDGHVVLSGPILRSEANGLVRAIRRVRGVHDVENRLEPHDKSENIPALMGPTRRIAHAPELLQEHWTPSLRILAGVLGTAAVVSGILRRPAGIVGIGLTGLGALLLTRATYDKPLERILGFDRRDSRRAVDLQKTITIHAPIEDVFAYWSSFERFPEFMDHIEEVRRLDNQRSHWRVRGPLGASVEWDAETTSFLPNERIAWRSVEGSMIENEGVVRFETADGGRATRLDVRLSYNPIVGYVGHSIAALFGVDPKKSLDQDLLRLKSLIEEGKTTAHGHEVTSSSSRPQTPPSRL